MKIIHKPIPLSALQKMAKERFGNLVKTVVDIDKKIMALDADLHADLEAQLIASGSQQENLWGINLYPASTGADFVEFDSMINLRPSCGNHSRGVDNPAIREKIVKIVNSLIKR